MKMYFFVGYVFTYAVGDQISSIKYLLELIEKISKAHERNMSRKCGLNSNQSKTEKYEPIRA